MPKPSPFHAGPPPLPRRLTLAAFAAPVAILAAVVAIYAVSPSFYLAYILEESRRERQAVEILTFILGVVASVLLVRSAIGLWWLERNNGAIRGVPGGPLMIAVVALACIFFTGEEASWGQSYIGWATPEAFRETMGNHETNLHNADAVVSVQMLGSIFLVATFFGLPILWSLRHKLPVPRDWRSAIPEGSVIFTFVCAFLWTRSKSVYLWLTPAEELPGSPIYVQFIDQMKEHKELLFSLGLLLYGAHRVRRLNWLRAAAAARPAPAEAAAAAHPGAATEVEAKPARSNAYAGRTPL